MPITDFYNDTFDMFDFKNDDIWNTCYPILRPFVSYLVRTFPVPSWRGQEADIVEDIVQEAIRKVLEYTRKVERGEALPIRSLKKIITTIAYNCYRDQRRHDRKLRHMEVYEGEHIIASRNSNDLNTQLFEAITEHMYQETLLALLAHEIARFPTKQRNALLTDLANLMCFDTQATPLQKAFAEVGVDLRQYQHPLPTNPRERNQHISILSYAYKRVAHLSELQFYL